MRRIASPVLAVALLVVIPGCGSDSKDSASSPTIPEYTLVYEYSGEGYRPLFLADAERKIDYVEVGRLTFTAIGHDIESRAWEHSTYDGGVVGFADGSSVTLTEISLDRSVLTHELVAVESN